MSQILTKKKKRKMTQIGKLELDISYKSALNKKKSFHIGNILEPMHKPNIYIK